MKKVSIDGGKTYCSPKDAINALTFEGEVDYDTLGYNMDSEILSRVLDNLDSPISPVELLTKYLEAAEEDFIVEV